ncbi:MAG: branched-chain amino acid ABC transporter substrate-binding protein [Ardenticatenaceae bacterium]|nr:branched-chain amino acid ABC transporter substrate-binding protein [Ardenticatenaceae bacterium]
MNKFSKMLVILLIFSLMLAACRRAPEEETVPAATEAPAETEEEMAPEEEETAVEPTEAPAEETEETMEEKPIKIGFLGPLTGGAAFIGQEQLGFAKVVVDIFNEEHGLSIEIVEGDTEINPDTGKIVAEQFAADPDIIGVVGPAGSQVCESTMPVFAEAGLAHVTPSCTRTDLTQPGTATFFRPIPTDAAQSQTDGDYMINVLGVTSVFIVDDQSSYAVGLGDELEAILNEAGVTVDRASVTQEETDFSSIATSVVAAGSDLVFFPGQIEGQLGTMAVQLREQGFDGIYFLPDGGFSLGWVETAGEAANGTYVSFFSPDPNLVPSAAPYNEQYAAEYSEDFGAFGGASAMVTQVLVEAIGRCADAGDISRSCVVTELGNTDMDTLLEVHVAFDENNQAQGGFSLFQVQDGSFTLLSEGEAGEMTESEGGEMLSADVPIKVAFLGPLTGGAAFIGQEQLGFVKVTVDLFNERTGLNVEVVEGDTEINPDVGKVVAEQVAADPDVYVVVGPAGSQVCESTQPVFAEAGLAHITPSCTRTDLTQPGTATFFRPIPTDADQSRTIAEHMTGDLGVSSVYIVDDQSSYAVGLGDELTALLEEAGVTVDRASVTQEETDFSSIATTAVASGAEVVFFPAQIEGQIGTLAVQLREQGFDGIYYLPDGGFSLGWIETAGSAADGTYVTFFSPDPNLVPTMAPYNEQYAAEYSEEFGAFGGAAGLAAYIAVEALETCVAGGDISRACVVDALANMNLETTPLGLPIAFGEGNQAEGGFSLFQIQDGQFVLLSGG